MDLGKADKMKMTYEQAVSYLYEIPKFTKKNRIRAYKGAVAEARHPQRKILRSSMWREAMEKVVSVEPSAKC